MSTPEQPEKLAPSSPEAEQAVLGCVLIHPETYLDCGDLQEPDFFIVKNGWVWDAIARLNQAGQPVTSLTVIETLRCTGEGPNGNRLDQIGGSAYITELINNAGDYQYTEVYARLIQHAATRRRLLATASAIAQQALEANAPIEKILADSESMLFAVTDKGSPSAVQSVGEVASQYYDTVERLHSEQTKVLGIPTGYAGLDSKLSGLRKGKVYVIAACTALGKTTFALHLAMNAARQHPAVPTLFLSLEMLKEDLVNRMVASAFNLNTQSLQLGQLSAEEWQRFTDGLAEIGKWPIYLDDTPDLTPIRLRRLIRRYQHEAGIQAVFVDYLQLMNPGRRFSNRELEISYLCRECKKLTLSLQIPIVLVAQLSREVTKREDKRPRLSDLRESGAIEQTADVVMFLYREDLYKEKSERPNQCDILVEKNRMGPTGIETLYFRKEYTQFTTMQTGKIDLTTDFGPRTPQHWPAPPPRRREPITPEENYHEKDGDR